MKKEKEKKLFRIHIVIIIFLLSLAGIGYYQIYVTKNWNPENSVRAKLQKTIFDSTYGTIKFHGVKIGSRVSVQIIEHSTAGIILKKSESPDTSFIAFNATESDDYELRNYTIFFDTSYHLVENPLLSDAEKMFYELHRKELEEMGSLLKKFLSSPTMKIAGFFIIKIPQKLGDKF